MNTWRAGITQKEYIVILVKGKCSVERSFLQDKVLFTSNIFDIHELL